MLEYLKFVGLTIHDFGNFLPLRYNSNFYNIGFITFDFYNLRAHPVMLNFPLTKSPNNFRKNYGRNTTIVSKDRKISDKQFLLLTF